MHGKYTGSSAWRLSPISATTPVAEPVAAVDLERVADRDVATRERPRARLDRPVAAGAQVDEVEAAPRDPRRVDRQRVHVGRGAFVALVRAGRVAGGRPEHAADRDAVGLVGDGALRGAVTGRGDDDRRAAPGVEAAGARAPELLAGEDRRVEHGRRPGRRPEHDRRDQQRHGGGGERHDQQAAAAHVRVLSPRRPRRTGPSR